MDDVAKSDPLEGWGNLLAMWPKQPWEFGEVLGVAVAYAFPQDSTLRYDARFIENVMRATVDHIERQGHTFKPSIDGMVYHDGARRAAGDLPLKYLPTNAPIEESFREPRDS